MFIIIFFLIFLHLQFLIASPELRLLIWCIAAFIGAVRAFRDLLRGELGIVLFLFELFLAFILVICGLASYELGTLTIGC